MFGRGQDQESGAEKPAISFPEMQEFEVKKENGEWETVKGHNCQIADGCLMIFRGVFINEDCTQPSAVPAGFFAPGEWKRVKTDYKGFERKSELAIH